MKAWLRSLVRRLEGGPWHEPDHWCGACAIGQQLAPYTAGELMQTYSTRDAYHTQPVREALPIDHSQRTAEIIALEEIRRL